MDERTLWIGKKKIMDEEPQADPIHAFRPAVGIASFFQYGWMSVSGSENKTDKQTVIVDLNPQAKNRSLLCKKTGF